MKNLFILIIVLFSSLSLTAQEQKVAEKKTELTATQKQEVENINAAYKEKTDAIKKDASLTSAEKEERIKLTNEEKQKQIDKIGGVSEGSAAPAEPAKANINRSRSNIKGK